MEPSSSLPRRCSLSPSPWQVQFQQALEKSGFEGRCQIIWAKNTFAWGFGRYKFQHEPIFYCHVKDQSDEWYGDKSQSTLWAEKKPAANRLQPTSKPVELIERALRNSSQTGDLVVDLFGGSGSTLIACERRDRLARLTELDPKYVDVIVTRWQDYTGKIARLDGDERSFDEIRAERLKSFLNQPVPPGDCGNRRQHSWGHPDIEGLCRALSDWSGELAFLLEEEG